MNKIYSLLAQDGKLKKIYEEYKKDISVGKYFEPTEHKIEGLHHLHFIMQELRRREGEYCFIRGNPNNTRLFGANSWRRVKYEKDSCFTIDEPKNWVMLDIDELEMREDERPTFEDARKRVIEEFDFIDKEDGMIITWSSSFMLSRKGEKPKRIWKMHIFIWFEEQISCQDLYDRLGNYPLIDRATVISNQVNLFEDPIIDFNYWDCELTERTHYFEGKSSKLPLFSRASPDINERQSTTIPLSKGIDSYSYENGLYQATQATDGRYRATFKFFVYVVNTNKNQDEAIRRVWKGENTSERFKTREDLEKKMEEARRFVLKNYLPTLNIGRHKLINLNTDNVSEKIEGINGVMLVKSPQATYKTQTLKKIPKNESLLVITHRQSLARDIANELGAFCYQDAKCDEELISQKRIVITHHSLIKLINKTKDEILDGIEFENVIIDESEQLIEDVMTTQLLEKLNQTNQQVFRYVGQFVQRAKNVYVADADLSDLTRLFLEIWRTDDEKFNIYENDYRLGGKTVYGFANPNIILDKVYDDLRNKKKVFITCERKKACEETFNNIKKKFPNANIIWITGDEDRKEKYKELFQDANKELPLLFNGTSRMNKGEFIGKKLDVLIVNSVMDTGFSIGKKEDMENRFHSVYGLFDNPRLLYTGSMMRQALRRVRNADRYYVYINNAKNYIRNIDEILANVYGEEISSNATYENLLTKIYKKKQISKHNRKLNFIAHLEDCGWRYQEQDDVANFQEYWKEQQKIRKQDEEKLLNAKEMTALEYVQKMNNHHFGDELAKKKFQIQQSFDSKINRRLIKRFKNGTIEETRKILDRFEKDAKAIAKEYGKDDVFIVETLKNIFRHFGIDASKMKKASSNEIILWSFQIDNKLMDYLFGDNRNAETLTFLLNEKYNLSLSATNFNGQENDKLKFFVKIAKAFDFDCKLQDKNLSAKNERRERVSFSVLKKHMKASVKKRKDSELIERFGGSDFRILKDKYIENLKASISQRKNIRRLEEEFLKDQESHIIFRGFEKPLYTRFLSNFIRNYSNDIPSIQPITKKTDQKTQTTAKAIREIENEI
jgi:hypothetical protein